MIRTSRWLSAGVLVALLAGCLMIPSRAEASTNVSFGFFYSNLSPHGSWLVSAEYGRVWQPYEYDRDWNPYYDGRWVYSDYGWTWVSDYSWGAVPYHYGTWYVDSRYGWVWVPGTVWAPSWVMFRTGPDYIGWCPVSPRFSVGASFRFGEPRYDSFVFVSSRDFGSRRIRGAAIRDDRRGAIYNNTRIVNNIRIENNVVVNRGPDVRSIERASGRQVRRYKIEEVSRVAPDRNFDRSQFRVDRRGSRDLRATEPIPQSRPLPPRESARDDRRYDRGMDRRNDRGAVPESRRDRRLGRPDTMDREDNRRPDLRSPSSGPEGRGPQREHDRSFDRDRRDSAQQPVDFGRGRTGQDRPDVRERDRQRDQREMQERREDRKPQMRERSQRDEQRQRQERPRRDDRQREQRQQKPREHKPEHDKPPHGN